MRRERRKIFLLAFSVVFLLFSIFKIQTYAQSQSLALTAENINNKQNYKNGWYKSWGGEFVESSGSISSITGYSADREFYYISINDSRVKIAVSEYDANGKWLKYSDNYQNGGKFVKSAGTSYIQLTISSSVWGVDVSTLFDNGLKIEFSSEQKEMYKTETTSIKNADFSNKANWKAGSFVYQTGECIIDSSKIAFYAYCVPDNVTYQVRLPGGYLKLNILELDAQNKVIASSDLHSGQKWTKRADTAKIALTVYTNDKKGSSYTYAEYQQLIESYPLFGLQPYQAYNVKGTMETLTATQFMQKMNVGWNLGNSLDSKCDKNSRGTDANLKQELNWGNPYITEEQINYVAQTGINTIRIPVTWCYNTGTDAQGNLVVGQQWLDRVREVVDYALKNDMYVIINSHHEQPILYAGVSEDEFQQVLANTQSLWTQIAQYFKDYDERLIFEGFNEIDNVEKSWNYSAKAAEQMNRMNQTFVSTVRGTGGNNAQRILMVPTLLDGVSSDILQAFVLPTDTVSDRLIVQVHSYTKKFCEDVDSDFAALESFSKRIGVPVIIGEFGTTSSYPAIEIRDKQASNYVARALQHGIKCIWWDNNSDYGIIDRRDFAKSNNKMIQALLAGANGIAYQSVGAVVINSKDQFVLKMPNLTSGQLEDAYWGTITSGFAWSSSSSGKCMLSLTALNEANDIWMQRILFYDAASNYISGKELQKKDAIVDIPAGTAYIKISLNSAYRNITWENYASYLKNGLLAITVSDTSPEKLKAVVLTQK